MFRLRKWCLHVISVISVSIALSVATVLLDIGEGM